MKHLFIITLVFSLQGFSRTLVISDIDDTIKVSHILSPLSKIGRAADVTTPFAGMAELYQLILKQNRTASRIVYLSNAPQKIAGIPALEFSHKSFLSLNGFPSGEVALRESVFDKNHKINEIRRLLAREKPELIILIGDNGERDPEIYHQIYNEFSQRVRIVTFIHQLYMSDSVFYLPDFLSEIGTRIYPEQVGFVTPIEIAVELKQQNLLDPKSYDWMIQNVGSYIVTERDYKRGYKWDGLRPITFPKFKNCKDFNWQWDITPELVPIYQKIMKSCS